MKFAFWNGGAPRVLRSNKNVILPSGGVVLSVAGPMPERDLYAFEENQPTAAAHQRHGTTTYTNDGWTITATVAVEDRSLDDVRAEKLAALAAYRFEIETGGIEVDGIAVATDRQSQALITGKAVYLNQNPDVTAVRWKSEAGFVDIPREDFLSLAAVVAEHVQLCFDNEATHSAAIEGLNTAAAIVAHDFTAGWQGR